MKLHDQHLHSRHSCDSQADPEANVRRAIQLGLTGLTFTEHFDTHPDEWDLCLWNYEAIRTTVDKLRERYGSEIFIGMGIEVCYQPTRMELILDELSRHEFDVVLLSVHYFGDRALHERPHWEGHDVASGTRRYLETVLEAVQTADRLRRDGRRVFDILGHLDLVKRYTQRFFKSFDVRPYGDLVDEVLRAAIAADLTLEVNTSTWRQSLGEPTPADWIIRRYAELGATAISLGSDAHRSDDVGAGLPEAADMLKRCGIEHAVVFRGRQTERVPLA